MKVARGSLRPEGITKSRRALDLAVQMASRRNRSKLLMTTMTGATWATTRAAGGCSAGNRRKKTMTSITCLTAWWAPKLARRRNRNQRRRDRGRQRSGIRHPGALGMTMSWRMSMQAARRHRGLGRREARATRWPPEGARSSEVGQQARRPTLPRQPREHRRPQDRRQLSLRSQLRLLAWSSQPSETATPALGAKALGLSCWRCPTLVLGE